MYKIKIIFTLPIFPPPKKKVQLLSAEKPLSPFSYVSFQNCALPIYKINNPRNKYLFSMQYVSGIDHGEQIVIFLAFKESTF